MKQISFIVILLSFLQAGAQGRIDHYLNRYSTQHGYSLKVTVEAGTRHKPNPVFRIVAAGGVASHFIADWLYPGFNLELQLYNGGMGSRNKGRFFNTNCDIIAALTLTGGGSNNFKTGNEQKLADRRVPLYYFADFCYPSLQNPFNYSLSIGTNVVFTPWNREKQNQRIGFINVNLNRVQISYYNDGGVPIYDTYLGDRWDRYYTGGAVVSYHGRAHTELNLVEFGFHKFTGYTKNAFEVSNKLYLAYMDYKQEVQQDYNKSLWSLNIANVRRGVGLHIRSYNDTKLDVQHLIHWGLFDAYHLVPYRRHIAVGINYYHTVPNIGLK